MIDEMTYAFDSPGGVSKVSQSFSYPEIPTDAGGAEQGRKDGDAAGFRLSVARSGYCGVRLGH
jgi:hypothetical protein